MQLLMPPKDTILALPKKASKKDCKMVFLGYKSLIPTGGRKKTIKINTQTATATQTAEAMPQAFNPIFEYASNTTTFAPVPPIKVYRETDDTLCYCFKCKKTINAIVTENTVNSTVGWHGRIVKMYKCPHCGQLVSDDDIFYPNCTYTVYRSYFLDGNKLKIRRKETVFRWYNNHLLIDHYQHLTIMNLDTGYSYRFPIFKNGKKIKDGHMVNCTYSCSGVDRTKNSYSSACKDFDEFYSEVYEIIRKYKMEKLNIFIPSYDEYYKAHREETKDSKSYFAILLNDKTPEMEDVLLFNRFPTMNPFKTLRAFRNASWDKELIKLRRSIKPYTKDPVKDILDFYGMPTTKITKKRTVSNINYPKYFFKLREVIDNYDNINKLLNEDTMKYMSNYDIESMCESLEVVKNIKGFNLNSFCNKAIGEERYIVSDTLRLAKQIIKKKEDYKFEFKGKLRDIHDKLAGDYNKLRHENQVIEYAEEYKELEGQYGELYFNLAKDTYELIEVGTTMNICVGGYGERAVDKKLNIMIARDADHNPVICIEMDKFYYDLEQTKLKFNHRIQEDTIEYAAIKEWAEKHSLHFDTYDVPEKLKEEHNELELVKRKGERIDALRGIDDTTRPQYARRPPLRGRPVVPVQAVEVVDAAPVQRPF